MKYETHRREYTVLGMSAGFQSFFRPYFIDFFGKTLKELIIVVKDGVYYHCQQEGDRMNLVKSILERINKNEIDLEETYNTFEERIQAYDRLIITPEEQYTKEMVLEFFNFYQQLWNLMYAGCDTMDGIEILKEEKRRNYAEWILKVRKRGESVCKQGEMEFMPRYLAWFSKNITPEYTPEELSYLLFKEMEDFLKESKPFPKKQELHKRKEWCYMKHSLPDKIELLSGEEAKEIIEQKKFFDEKDYSTVKEIKGRTAHPGKVQGKVSIIITREDINKFKEGDILVSEMTDPSFLHIMEKASAIVTNEGGALCHAAIVARELQKPCITGTKIATKVLKDGDEVEVDAEKGTITKL
jgi:phosphoenolpyruvate synthase/pyruvate phosphate dikinase